MMGHVKIKLLLVMVTISILTEYSGMTFGQQCLSKSKQNHLLTPIAVYSTRSSGIICTIGPSSWDVDKLVQMIKAGCKIARLNFSQGNHQSHGAVMTNVTKAEAIIRKSNPHFLMAIALDTKGPEIRTGVLKQGLKHIDLVTGAPVKLSTDPRHVTESSADLIYIDYPKLTQVVKTGDAIFVEDGMITLRVTKVNAAQKEVMCVSETTRKLGSRKGVNLPGIKTDLPAVTEQDKKDLLFGVSRNIDMVFASFIRDAAGVKEVRKHLSTSHKKITVISKIECQEALDNLDEIIRESDGLMVARGDLSIETPAEDVPYHREVIVTKSNRAGKPVVTATQMLETMIKSHKATAAERSDIATAIKEGSDCVMLSGESAAGDYPVAAVQTMARVVGATERFMNDELFKKMNAQQAYGSQKLELARAAVQLSFGIKAKAIIVITTRGDEAHLVSAFKPKCPIIAVFGDEKTARQALIWKGIMPLLVDYKTPHNLDDTAAVNEALRFGRATGILKPGEKAIIISKSNGGLHIPDDITIFTIEK